MATIIISPVRAAIGKTSRPAPNMTKAIKQWLQQFQVLLTIRNINKALSQHSAATHTRKQPDKIFATP
jgi:hypothetical protein